MPGFHSALGLLAAAKESLTLTKNARAVVERLHDPELCAEACHSVHSVAACDGRVKMTGGGGGLHFILSSVPLGSLSRPHCSDQSRHCRLVNERQ